MKLKAMKNSWLTFTFLIVLIVFTACEDSYPRPKGYVRIDLPEHQFEPFSVCRTQSVKSVHAEIKRKPENKCWFNVHYPNLKADLHVTYLPVEDNLFDLIKEVHQIKDRHNQMASYIPEKVISSTNKEANGLQFDIQGKKAATPLNFYLTDSTNHFVTASLYFNHSPNNDSIRPVINWIKEDIDVLIKKWEWVNE